MKLLYITPFDIKSVSCGAYIRIYNILKYLSRNNKVDYYFHNYAQLDSKEKIKNIKNVKFKPVGPSIRMFQFFNPFLLSKLMSATSKEKPDKIIVSFPWTAIYAKILKSITGTPYYLDLHNVEYKRFKEQKKFPLLNGIFKTVELSAYKSADKIFCVSKEDMNFLKKQGIPKTKLVEIPNGSPTPKPPVKSRINKIKKKYSLKNKKVVLFFGNYSYPPNLDAFNKILNKISKHKLMSNTVFMLVGPSPPIERGVYDNVIVTGEVPVIEDYIHLSDMIVTPIMSGGGTRLKILEGLMCSKPVLSTSKGAEGIDKKVSGNLLSIENKISAFPKKIKATLSKSKKYKLNKQFKDKYSWEKIVKKMEANL